VGYSIHWMNSKIDDGKILKVREIDPQTKDYSLIPYISSKHEAKDLGELLQEMKVAGKISGYDNSPQRKVYTKNPTVREIKEMRQKGIRL